MPNLPINSAVTVPGLQFPENSPTAGIETHQPGSGMFDFSKALADAVRSHHDSKLKTKAHLAKDDAYPRAGTYNDQDKVVSKNSRPLQQQSKIKDIQDIQASSKDDEPDHLPADVRRDAADDDSSAAVPANDSRKHAPQVKSKQNTNSADIAAASAMAAPVSTFQPSAVTTEIDPTIANLDANENSAGSIDAVSNVAAKAVNGIAAKTIINSQGQVLDPAIVLNSSSQAAINNNPDIGSFMPGKMVPAANAAKAPDGMQNVIPPSGVGQNTAVSLPQNAVTANSEKDVTAAAQNLQSQSVPLAVELTGMTSRNQSTDAEQKAKAADNLKSGTDNNSQTTEALTPVTDLKKADAANQNQLGGGIKGVVNETLPANKDNHHLTATEKGQQPGYQSMLTEVSGKAGKGQTLNMPVIQTQLSVNHSDDKSRNDIALVSGQMPQHANGAGAETAKASVNNVNKDDLFAQIVEKAKVSMNNGTGEMEVNLKPDHLGKLHLKVSVENQLVTAKFVAESQQVKEIIETNLNQLRRNLQDTGIQVDQLMVSVGQQNNGGNFQNASHTPGGFVQHGSFAAAGGEVSDKPQEHHSQEKRYHGDGLIDLIA
jgi:Flagellar hook-length control protein